MALNTHRDGFLDTLSQIEFKDAGFHQVQFMRKVKGYDIFVLACKGSLLILELRSTSDFGASKKGSKEFQVLNRLENLFNSYIFEVAVTNDLLIPVALGGKDECLKIIQLYPKARLGGHGVTSEPFSRH